MLKDLSKKRTENKIKKHKESHQSLKEFYSQDQKDEEKHLEKKKKVTDTEMEIFEHLKNHTKKVLKK